MHNYCVRLKAHQVQRIHRCHQHAEAQTGTHGRSGRHAPIHTISLNFKAA